MQNCMNECRRSWVPFSTWGVPFGTFRVSNGTWSRHDTYAMVGRLLTLFQCVFRVFMLFEKYFLRVWPWNTFLLCYKLYETYLNLIKNWCSLYWWSLLQQISVSWLAKHNNHKQKSFMASNQNFSHSTIHDINRWVRSFDFSTKTNFYCLQTRRNQGSEEC